MGRKPREHVLTNDEIARIKGKAQALKDMDVEPPVSIKGLMEDIFPDLAAAAAAGKTRRQMYDLLLDDSLKKRISFHTFANYYHKIKRQRGGRPETGWEAGAHIFKDSNRQE